MSYVIGVHRFAFTEKAVLSYVTWSCVGGLHLFNTFMGFGLEDTYRNPGYKLAGKTAIPYGRYALRLRVEGGMHQRYSDRWPWHEGMLWLQDVPNFEWVYMHPGNTVDHTEGCPLIGEALDMRGTLARSAVAYERLYKAVVSVMRDAEVFVDVLPVTQMEARY